MTPDEYQALAARTICPQMAALGRIQATPRQTQILHGVIGLQGESGEMATQVEGHIWYGKPFDQVNMEEEIGDALWYLAEICSAMGVSMEDIMERNIAKLRQRFPKQFDYGLADESQRDRMAERAILKGQRDVE